jgi:hypothetical protein
MHAKQDIAPQRLTKYKSSKLAEEVGKMRE